MGAAGNKKPKKSKTAKHGPAYEAEESNKDKKTFSGKKAGN